MDAKYTNDTDDRGYFTARLFLLPKYCEPREQVVHRGEVSEVCGGVASSGQVFHVDSEDAADQHVVVAGIVRRAESVSVIFLAFRAAAFHVERLLELNHGEHHREDVAVFGEVFFLEDNHVDPEAVAAEDDVGPLSDARVENLGEAGRGEGDERENCKTGCEVAPIFRGHFRKLFSDFCYGF